MDVASLPHISFAPLSHGRSEVVRQNNTKVAHETHDSIESVPSARVNNSTASAKEDEAKSNNQYSQGELEVIQKLKARDREVRAHEQAHAITGGQYAGSPSYSYQKGPDGKNYAIGGKVPIDVAKVANDPEATIRKMDTVYRAALAPAQPSGQDRRVASEALSKKVEAQAELNQTKREEQQQVSEEKQAVGSKDENETATDKDSVKQTSQILNQQT